MKAKSNQSRSATTLASQYHATDRSVATFGLWRQKIPTVLEILEKQLRDFERPEVIEQLRPLQATVDKVFGCCLVIGAALKSVADSPPSFGYEPWLIDRGSNSIAARGLAHLTVRHGNRRANDRERVSSIVGAIRYLAKPHRNRPARHRRIILLLRASQETSVLETIFVGARLSELEFVHLLKLAADGDEGAYRRITEIAAGLVPRLSSPRGPKIRAASAAHEFFLETAIRFEPSRYTWSDSEDDFTDQLTAATRREFNDNDFHPQPAVRRFKARMRSN